MYVRILALLVGLQCCSVRVAAQTTGALAGSVVGPGGAPIVDATVQAVLPDTSYTTIVGKDGGFMFDHLPTGMYGLRVSHVGYHSVELPEVWVRAGKAEVVYVELSVAAVELGSVEIRSAAPGRMSAVSTIPLTVERSLRFPATFFDPARLAMSSAGVASTNDQANHFSVRGNSPANNAWLLEGVEIVTPNHLTNAGTQSDLPTLTGGGTTILSAQMLGSSQLLTGGMSAPYGNALGGIMDLRLRRGIAQRRAYTLQAGLIGIDLSAEGPFRKGGRATYLINYRYSTLGLLGAMGVELGEEAISFQDLAFTVNLPFGERSELLLFGMGGNSSNRFAMKDSVEREYDKDSQDIDYEARMAATGLSFSQRIGQRTLWKTTVAWSVNEQERTSRTAPYRRIPMLHDTAGLDEMKLSAHTRMVQPIGSNGRLESGVGAMERRVGKHLFQLDERSAGWLLRPYLRYEHRIGERVDVDLGLAYAHWTANGSGALEPRASLRARLTARNTIQLAVGVRSQLPPVQSYADHYEWRTSTANLPTDNTGMGLMRSRDAELNLGHAFNDHFRSDLNLFLQQQCDIPVGVYRMGLTQGGVLSAVNLWDDITALPLDATGEARMIGGQIGLEQTLFRSFYYQINATLLDATYVDGLGTRYIGNMVFGREFAKQKEKVKRTWGVSGRLNMTGGQRYTSTGSLEDPDPIPYGTAYPGSYRVDLRIYLRREREGRTGLWALDLLNATNARNVAYRYFDFRQGKEVTKYQLGLIPNFSYRIEF